MFDLDGFKSYNDTYGHLAGDQLLTRVAQTPDRVVSSIGRAYRLGGDEFCVLLDTTRDPGRDHRARRAGNVRARDGIRDRRLLRDRFDSRRRQGARARHCRSPTRVCTPTRTGRRAATFIAQTRDVLLRATAEHSADLYQHMLEVGELSRDVARRLGLDAEMLDLTLRTGELHDVGKVAIPTSVLSKPGSAQRRRMGSDPNPHRDRPAHPERRAGAPRGRDVRPIHP